ncbi:phosphonopyruvate decarboxylase [Streptomyces sp. SID2955]|nr:phosphonopyruvate decarboxylase [Streptomyces sp. SID2955]
MRWGPWPSRASTDTSPKTACGTARKDTDRRAGHSADPGPGLQGRPPARVALRDLRGPRCRCARRSDRQAGAARRVRGRVGLQLRDLRESRAAGREPGDHDAVPGRRDRDGRGHRHPGHRRLRHRFRRPDERRVRDAALRAGGHRRALHRGQALPEDQQLRRRGPGPAARRGLRPEAQERQGRAVRPRHRADRPHRGADRRAAGGGGPGTRARLRRRGRRRGARAQQEPPPRGSPGVRLPLAVPGAAGRRTDHLQHRDRGRALRRRVPPGDLREPGTAGRGQGHAGGAARSRRGGPGRRDRGADRADGRGLRAPGHAVDIPHEAVTGRTAGGSDALLAGLEDIGVSLVSGVPCSYFKEPIRRLERHPRIRYVPAVNEGSALAVAAGARLTGEPTAVIAQNSGFGNLVNPLTSLVLPYRIPVLVLVSMRGWPTADAGEPQHHWMGKVVPAWLDSLEVPYWWLTADGPSPDAVVAQAGTALDSGRSAFVLVGKGALRDTAPEAEGGAGAQAPDRDDLVAAVLAEVGEERILSTTGYLSRTLYNGGDRPGNFYMQGSMGHVAALGLGAALARPEDRFVVLDGDGSALMHLGSLATVGHHAPANLVHVVFDNQAYDSTGGQPTTSGTTDFAAVARAVGYRQARRVGTRAGLRPALRALLDAPGPSLLAVDGKIGGAPGERASSSLSVTDIAARFTALHGAAVTPGTAREEA